MDKRSNLSHYCKLYLVLETSQIKYPLEHFLDMAISGGVTAIQLRDKMSTAREMYDTGKTIKDFLTKKDVLFIINDRCDVAEALDVNGVHIGIKDIPLDVAKQLMGDKIIGYSCNTNYDCLLANNYADYVGTGPVYPTDTKQDLRKVIGVDGIKRNVDMLEVPSVAIGGINLSNAKHVLSTGVTGLAVSSYICASDDVYNDVLALSKLL